MPHFPSLGVGLSLATAMLVAGCASDGGLPSLPMPSMPSLPNWHASDTSSKPAAGPRTSTGADLVSGEGQCAALEPTAATASGEGGPTAVPTPPGTASLGMTECEVVRRVGQPTRVEVGSDDRAERTVVVTYLQGARPGIYRFRGGRLVSIERAGEPAPAKPEKRPQKPKPRSPAGT